MFEPLDLANLKTIAAFHVLDRWSVTPDRFAQGPAEFYRVNSGRKSLLNGRIHASRVYWLYGQRRSPRAKVYAGGFDASILESIAEPYLAYKSAITNASRMLQDYDVIFHQIKDLGKVSAAACKGDKNAQAQLDGIKEVLRISHKSKSIFRSYVGDKDNESFENITRNVGGYRDIADFVKEFLPACSEFPPAVLFGEFAGTGLGSGSKSAEDKELWNDTIRTAQAARLGPLMTGMPSRRRKQPTRPPGILDLICAQKDGPFKGKQPEGLTWAWNDLYPQTAADKATSETAWAGVLASVAAFDPRFTGQFILSRFANADSPIVLSPEYVETLRDEAKNPVDPNAMPPGEEFPAEEAPVEEVPVTDSADSPIVVNMRAALSMPMGTGVDFSPSAIRVARSVVGGARMTDEQVRSCKAWMNGKKRYAKMPKGHPQHTAWLLRGGDEGYKSYGGRS